MDDHARAAYEEQSLQLRAELKKWEGDWATAHAGKKPGREDIKQNPDIAQKYKQYNKLRDILAGRAPPPRPAPIERTEGRQHRKRTQSDAALPPQTPSKRSKPAQTQVQTPSATHAALTPSLNRTVLTPVAAIPTSIGPTPQKDGRVLGLFDLLGRTPSRGSTTLTVTATNPLSAATPSKQRPTDLLPSTTAVTPTAARFATTPQSKRTTTAAFSQASTTTPSHSRQDKPAGNAATGTTSFKTPSANRVSKQPVNSPAGSSTSSTPSFLRRRKITTTAAVATGLSSLEEQDEDDGGADEEAWKKIGPLRLPRKLNGIGRSLSSVVAGLRKMEEEAFGEEEEILREMEMGAGGRGSGQVAKKGGEVEVGDSQVQAQTGHGLGEGQASEKPPIGLLSGFDDELLHDNSDEETQQNTQQQPLRTFKKRGQKRTTRLVNMRPTRAKRPAQTNNQPDSEDEEEEDDEIVRETQFNGPTANTQTNNNDLRLSDLDSSSDHEFDGSDSEGEGDGKGAKPRQKQQAPGKDNKGKDNNKAEGVVKRAVRKVKATAHANFKRLKLRNSGAKGGAGHNSRWRRRR